MSGNRYGPNRNFDRRDMEAYERSRMEDDRRDMGDERRGDGGNRGQCRVDFSRFQDRGQWQQQYEPPPEWQPPVGYGIYLCIKFNCTAAEIGAHAAVLNNRSILSYKGRFQGIARKIEDLSSGPKQKETLLLYWFCTPEGAQRFFESDDRFKQHDFPPQAGAGSCEAWLLNKCRDTGKEDYTTFMMCTSTPKRTSREDFYEYRDYVNNPLGKLIEKYDGMPFVTQNEGAHSLRRANFDPNDYVTVHMFKSPEHAMALMEDEEYNKIKSMQRPFLKNDRTSVFTIDHVACP